MFYVPESSLNCYAGLMMLTGLCVKIGATLYVTRVTFDATLPPAEALKTWRQQRKLLEKLLLLGWTADWLFFVGHRVRYSGLFEFCSPAANTLSLCAIVLMSAALCATLTAHALGDGMERRERFLIRMSDEFVNSSYLVQMAVFLILLLGITTGTHACAIDENIEKTFSLLLNGADVTQYSANDTATPFML